MWKGEVQVKGGLSLGRFKLVPPQKMWEVRKSGCRGGREDMGTRGGEIHSSRRSGRRRPHKEGTAGASSFVLRYGDEANKVNFSRRKAEETTRRGRRPGGELYLLQRVYHQSAEEREIEGKSNEGGGVKSLWEGWGALSTALFGLFLN